MLEALFEEGSGDDKSSGSDGKRKKNVAKPSPRDQNSTTLAGITNQGATCYLNSLIQTLLFTPELRDAVFSLRSSELGKIEEEDCRRIPLELQLLFANMLLLDQSSVSTSDLTDSFGWTNNEELSQHDVQELNRILFDAVEHSLTGLTNSEIVNQLYRGTIVNQIRCTECDYISERLEPYLDLTVAVAGYSDLAESLTDCYLNAETLSGNNQYKCDSCNKLVDAEKGAKIRELPPVLTFCLLRLNFDFQKLERVKETSNFKFPHEINMGAYMDSSSDMDTDYELFSVVIHRGGAHGGHYHAIIRDIDQLGVWSTPAEKPLTTDKVQSKKSAEDLLNYDNPTDLINHILNQELDWITTDQLSQRIQQTTGVSWNKRFKNRHGTLAKFINYHSDLYAYEDSSRKIVLLSKLSVEAPAMTDSVETEEMITNTTSTSDDEAAAHWFAFDDRRIRPVRQSDIERYYGGKECAYMLFYRRKSLQRPTEALRNKEHLIPEHVLEKITEENRKLREEREAEELKLNTVTVKAYLQSKYTFSDNQIHAKSDHTFQPIEIDQRKHVKELNKELLLQLGDDDVPLDDDHALYVVKPCYDVLHPMIELTDDETWESDTKIAACGIDSNSGVLLVSRGQVLKHKVLCGSEHIPYQVTFQNDEDSQTVLLAKSTSLQDLPLHVMKLFQLQPPIYLSYKSDRNGKIVEVPLAEDEPLHRHVDDQTILKISNLPILSINSSMINVFVQGTLQDKELKKQSISLELAEDIAKVVGRLRREVIQEYELPESTKIRLRCMKDNNAGPPLNPERTVSESHLINGDTLLIEEGAPVPSGHIALYYKISESPIQSIVCRCNNTIDEAIISMVDNSNLDKDSKFYIMTQDWMGDATEVVYTTHHTLAKARIKNGDTVTLVQGIPPPKDLITLNLHWRSEEITLSYMEWLVNSMNEMSLDEKTEAQKSDYLVAPIKVSLDATVLELKEQVGETIPYHDASTVNHIRLRVMSNGKVPGQILKTPEKTLRACKLREGLNLCMEVTEQAEYLGESEILLNLRQRDHDGDYGQETQLLWDTSDGATARKLKTQIAANVGCDVSNLCIAKYHAPQQEWRMIKITKPANRKGGKKKTVVEQNICKAPCLIQDGDLIGFIILDSTAEASDRAAVTADTFLTDTDRNLKQANIDRKREQRKQKTMEGGDLISHHAMSTRNGSTKEKRVEKAISIKVGTFAAKKSPSINVES